jgi:hypothetical protein
MPVADQPADHEQGTCDADSRCDVDPAEEEACRASVIGPRGAA